MGDYNIGQLVGQTTGTSMNWVVGWSNGNESTDNRSCVKLRFYVANGVTPSAIIMNFNDGTSAGFYATSQDGANSFVDVPLSPGEMITSWTVYNRIDGGKGFAGFIILTNMKKSYAIGTKLGGSSTSIDTINLGSGLLTGFYIAWDTNKYDILGIKPFFLKPFKSVTMQNINFGPAFTDMKMYTNPVNIAESTIQNKSTEGQSWTFEDSISRETSHEWSHSTATMFGASVSMKTGFLGIDEVSASANWSFTDTYTTTNTIKDTTQLTWGANGNVPAGQTITATAGVWSGALSLPYTATMNVLMVDDSLGTLTYQDNGIYNNVQYSSAQVTISTPSQLLSTMSIQDHIRARKEPIKASLSTVYALPQVSQSVPKLKAEKTFPTMNGFIPSSENNKSPILEDEVDGRDDDELSRQLKALGQAVNRLLQSKMITA